MANETPKTVKVRVLRAFQVKEKLYKADTTVELERRFAIEMKTANKVEFVTEGETRSDPSTQSASKVGKASKES